MMVIRQALPPELANQISYGIYHWMLFLLRFTKLRPVCAYVQLEQATLRFIGEYAPAPRHGAFCAQSPLRMLISLSMLINTRTAKESCTSIPSIHPWGGLAVWSCKRLTGLSGSRIIPILGKSWGDVGSCLARTRRRSERDCTNG